MEDIRERFGERRNFEERGCGVSAQNAWGEVGDGNSVVGGGAARMQ